MTGADAVEPPERRELPGRPGDAPVIVCLLPVRNGGGGLQGWLDGAGAFCDAVVALDDGSTDATGDILRSHPIVASTLENPRRESFLGWHDGLNRNRLLAAAGELRTRLCGAGQPLWLVSVDADERIDGSDAAALRRFVAGEALPGCAYGMRVFRMVTPPGEEPERHDPGAEWVYRLFAHADGQRFPHRRIDFVPVPSSIPMTAWVRTTIRIKHDSEPDEDARAARVAKYREVDPEGAFARYYEAFQPFSTGPFPVWAPLPADGPVLLGASSTAGGLVGQSPPVARLPFVVAMLPARNAAEHLPGWFESVSRFADAVVALDDGSTDGTGDMLRAHPLARAVLTNPRRDTYAGWDDAANRARLVAAAVDAGADWVVGLDADERIPVDDGIALRRFVAEEAQPSCAYGFPVHRMIGDGVELQWDRTEMVAFRMFACPPGADLTLRPERLHGVPVPAAIPQARWIPTTIRIQHLGGVDAARREARYAKYGQADPGREWEADYEYTRVPEGERRAWELRPRDLAVVDWSLADEWRDLVELRALSLDGPVLTVAVVGGVAGRLALAAELVDVAVEVITAADANAALAAAQGDYLTLVDGTEEARGAWLAAGAVAGVVAAHEKGHAVVFARAAGSAQGAAGPGLSARFGLPGPPASFATDAVRRAGGFDLSLPVGARQAMAKRLMAAGFTAASVDALALPDPAVSLADELALARAMGDQAPAASAPLRLAARALGLAARWRRR